MPVSGKTGLVRFSSDISNYPALTPRTHVAGLLVIDRAVQFDRMRTFRQNRNLGTFPIAPRVRRIGGMTSDLFHGLEWTMLRNVIPNFTLGHDYLC